MHPQPKQHPKHITHSKQDTQPNSKPYLLPLSHPDSRLKITPYPYSKPKLHLKFKTYHNNKITLAYHPHHKPNLKNHIANKWKSHITTKHIPQDNPHTYLLTRYNIHQNHKPYPEILPYSKPNFHITPKVISTSRPRHLTNDKRQTTSTKQILR